MVPEVEHQPLALCDIRSVDPTHMMACDRILVDKLGEVYLLQYHQDQKWYWLDKQTPSEPYLIVTWDSETNGKARCMEYNSMRVHLLTDNSMSASLLPEQQCSIRCISS